MKPKLLTLTLFATLILCMSGFAMAKLFVVEIDGQKIVADFYVEEEQAWQFTQEGEMGWWDGLAPHPYECRIWHPHLSETFGMVLTEQLEWIEELDYAGIEDWRIGCFWDTIPLKASMFGGITLGMGPNRLSNFNSDVYFLHTAVDPWNDWTTGELVGEKYSYHGRTGDELGDPALGGNGAIIEAGGGMFDFDDFDPNDDLNYKVWGRHVFDPPTAEFYTLVPTHGQDHWLRLVRNDGSMNFNMFDGDINCSPDHLTYVIQGEENPVGVWTVAETIPELPLNGEFHTISISDVINPKAGDPVPEPPDPNKVPDPNVPQEPAGPPPGTLVSVTGVEVLQDEPVGDLAPDAKVIQAAETTYVQVRAETNKGSNGRVYHIAFTDSVGDRYTFKVGVPGPGGKLVDDGALYDSTG